MTQVEEPARRRGSIRQRGNSLQVRLFAGTDPVTGRDVYLAASITGTDKKAHKRAEDKLAEFRTQVNKQRSTPSSVKLGYAIEEWMRTSEHEDSTREGYRGYITRTIRPALGEVPINKLTARMLEGFYAELGVVGCGVTVDRSSSTRSRESMTARRRSARRMCASQWLPRPCGRSTRSSAAR
jgi:hypothetical protein